VPQKTALMYPHYNFNAHQSIFIIFGRDVAERVMSMLANGDLLFHLS